MKYLITSALSAVLTVLVGTTVYSQTADSTAPTNPNCSFGVAEDGTCLAEQTGETRPYEIGGILPDDITYDPVPETVANTLPPLDEGHVYGQIDGDILLIDPDTREVIEAVIPVDAAIEPIEERLDDELENTPDDGMNGELPRI